MGGVKCINKIALLFCAIRNDTAGKDRIIKKGRWEERSSKGSLNGHLHGIETERVRRHALTISLHSFPSTTTLAIGLACVAIITIHVAANTTSWLPRRPPKRQRTENASRGIMPKKSKQSTQWVKWVLYHSIVVHCT